MLGSCNGSTVSTQIIDSGVTTHLLKRGLLLPLLAVLLLDLVRVDLDAVEVTVVCKNRGFGLEVSNLRGGLSADARMEVGSTCLGGEW